MKIKNEIDKEQIIKDYGENFYNALDKTSKGIIKIIRENNCKNNDFIKKIYEKRDKLREQKEKEKNILE